MDRESLIKFLNKNLTPDTLIRCLEAGVSIYQIYDIIRLIKSILTTEGKEQREVLKHMRSPELKKWLDDGNKKVSDKRKKTEAIKKEQAINAKIKEIETKLYDEADDVGKAIMNGANICFKAAPKIWYECLKCGENWILQTRSTHPVKICVFCGSTEIEQVTDDDNPYQAIVKPVR